MRGLTGEAGSKESSFVFFFFFHWLAVKVGRGDLRKISSLKRRAIFGTSCLNEIERWFMLD